MNNEKLRKLLEGIYDSLTDEQKEKVRACKSDKELRALLSAEGVELPDEMLDEVSGGGLWDWVCGWFETDLVDPPKYPCPKCGSWKVRNYDPGTFYMMRVACNDCHFWGCRDGTPD